MPKISLDKMQRFVIVFVVIGVAGAVGLDIMGSVKEAADLDRSIEGETFNSTADPYTYTVAEASDSEFKELTSITVYDSTSRNTALTATVTDASAGKIEVNGSASDGDLEVVDYNYLDYDTEAQEGATDAIDGMNELLGFLPVIGLVIAAAVVISLVSGFGGSGGRRGRN